MAIRDPGRSLRRRSCWTSGAGDSTTGRALSRDLPAEAAGPVLRRNPGGARRGFHQYCVYVGCAVPAETARLDRRPLGEAMTDDMRRLLGGYATGTLTEAERRALFEASLHDQQLFEALADEEALRELLEDPAARAALLQATETPKFTVAGGLREWFDRPKSKILLATGCVALAAIGYRTMTARPAVHVAQIRTPEEAHYMPAPLPRVVENVPDRPAPAAPAAKAISRKPEPASQPKEQPASAPEPAAAAQPAGESAARVSVIHYTLFRRSASGEFVPVPEDYLFSAEDQIRLQVEATRAGYVGITDDSREMLFAAPVTPGAPLVIPRTLAVGDRDRTLQINFSETAEFQRPQAQAVRSEFRAKERTEGASMSTPAPARLAPTADTDPRSVSFRVVLRHKP